MATKRGQKKEKQQSTAEQVRQMTRDGFMHQHSARINREQRVNAFELAEVEKEVAALTGALAAAKQKRVEIAAHIAGLNDVMATRK